MTPSDRKLFNDIVLPNLDSAYRLARGLAGNTADAEDIVQDACLRALKGIGGYAGGNPKAWMLAITRNAAFTHMARRQPGKLLLAGQSREAELALENMADESETAETGLIARADVAEIEAALNGLPPQFREIIVLREYNDLSYREIADMTRLPIGTVMSRLARARGLMLRALAPSRLGKTAS